MNTREKLTPDTTRSEATTATGAAFGAALAGVLVWFAEKLPFVGDIPPVIEGSMLVVVVYLVARFLPAR